MGERRKAKRQVRLRTDDAVEARRQEELEFRRLGYAEYVEDPGIVRGLLVSLHQRVAAMNVNLSAKLEELHTDQDTCSQLRAIRLQLSELARTVESCQGEVADIKKDVVAIKCDIEQLQATKEEIEELRDCVERLEEQHRRRRLRLLEQVGQPVRMSRMRWSSCIFYAMIVVYRLTLLPERDCGFGN